MYKIKWKTNKYHIIGTVPKSDRKIVDRGKINTTDTIIHFPEIHCDICKSYMYAVVLYFLARRV
jgi:hypothetical protein